MENGMVDNVVTKIKKMQLSITNGQELYDYISQSKMSEEHKAKLVLCVDEKLSTPTQEEPRQGFVVKPQLLVNIGSYMTAADWSQLEDPSLSWLAKSTVVIKRLKMLGVRSLHERTSQHCLAALLSTLSKLPDHSMIWEMLLSFKATFKQSEIPHAAPYLQTFPASPQDLPAHIFNVAYVGDDQPIENKNIDVIKHIAGSHISCRSTNKLLKSSGDNSKGQSAKGQPASAAEVAAGEQHQQAQFDPMKMCATMMQAMCATMARQGQFANMFNTNTEVKISPKKKEPKANTATYEKSVLGEVVAQDLFDIRQEGVFASQFALQNKGAASKKFTTFLSQHMAFDICYTCATLLLHPTGKVSKTDFALYRDSNDMLGCGEVWLHCEVDGKLWTLLSVWKLESYSSNTCSAIWAKTESTMLLDSQQILCPLTWQKHGHQKIVTLVQMPYRPWCEWFSKFVFLHASCLHAWSAQEFAFVLAKKCSSYW